MFWLMASPKSISAKVLTGAAMSVPVASTGMSSYAPKLIETLLSSTTYIYADERNIGNPKKETRTGLVKRIALRAWHDLELVKRVVGPLQSWILTVRNVASTCESPTASVTDAVTVSSPAMSTSGLSKRRTRVSKLVVMTGIVSAVGRYVERTRTARLLLHCW